MRSCLQAGATRLSLGARCASVVHPAGYGAHRHARLHCCKVPRMSVDRAAAGQNTLVALCWQGSVLITCCCVTALGGAGSIRGHLFVAWYTPLGLSGALYQPCYRCRCAVGRRRELQGRRRSAAARWRAPRAALDCWRRGNRPCRHVHMRDGAGGRQEALAPRSAALCVRPSENWRPPSSPHLCALTLHCLATAARRLTARLALALQRPKSAPSSAVSEQLDTAMATEFVGRASRWARSAACPLLAAACTCLLHPGAQ